MMRELFLKWLTIYASSHEIEIVYILYGMPTFLESRLFDRSKFESKVSLHSFKTEKAWLNKRLE